MATWPHALGQNILVTGLYGGGELLASWQKGSREKGLQAGARARCSPKDTLSSDNSCCPPPPNDAITL
jgi:hypothetical protein